MCIYTLIQTYTNTHIHTSAGRSHVYSNLITTCILVCPGLIKHFNSSHIDGKKLDVNMRIVFMIYLMLYCLATHEVGYYELTRKDRGTLKPMCLSLETVLCIII